MRKLLSGLKLVEKTGQITVKLKNDREVALKVSKIMMEDLEPVVCNF